MKECKASQERMKVDDLHCLDPFRAMCKDNPERELKIILSQLCNKMFVKGIQRNGMKGHYATTITYLSARKSKTDEVDLASISAVSRVQDNPKTD